MTEFEAATVAYQTASLAIQQAQLWTTYAQAGGALLVGGAQCGLIAWGIRVMRDSNHSRDATLTALRDQSQTLADVGQSLRDQSQTLAAIGAGIQELLRERRTP